MGRERRNLPPSVAGGPKERHKRTQRSQHDPKAPMPEGLVAKPAIPKSKHHSYFEFVENKDKKKKLDFKITFDASPLPGFEFIPVGNPKLTTACKELSRAQGAMIYITAKESDPNSISHHIHRTGFHVRQAIADQARASLNQLPFTASLGNGKPEPLPKTQNEYTLQVDGAIRDLFPRIPHTDRQAIIVQSFNLAMANQRPPPVGLVADMPLSRRVQLAALAHIRHNHTRYDQLLRETTYQNARRVVEGLCLDILVKWRGDEETGRDQLDEILREVVVISDSEGDSDEEEEQESDNSSVEIQAVVARERPAPQTLPLQVPAQPELPQVQRLQEREMPPLATTNHDVRAAAPAQAPVRREERGFRRYYRAWQAAVQRNRDENAEDSHADGPRPANNSLQPHLGPGPAYPGGSSSRVPAGGGDLVPSQHGFVQQQPLRPGPLTLDPKPDGRLDSPARPVYETVRSANRERFDSESRSRRVTPVALRLEDMLVHSIEPMSPEVPQPSSFGHALPPRTQASPVHRNVLHRLEPSPLPRDRDNRDGMYYPDGRVLQDRPSQSQMPRGQFGAPVQQVYTSSDYRNPVYREKDSPVFRTIGSSSEQQLQHPDPMSGVAARRIVLDAPRPGERSNPILMEDRGGFYERVPPRQTVVRETPYSRPAEPDLGPARRVFREPRRAPEHHRVASWGDGPRPLAESRDPREIRAIPLSGFYDAPASRPSIVSESHPPPLAHSFIPRHHNEPEPPLIPGAGRYEHRYPQEAPRGQMPPRQGLHYDNRPPPELMPVQQPLTRQYISQQDRVELENRNNERRQDAFRRSDGVIVLD